METLWQRPPTIWYDWPVADQESYETTRLRLRAYRESDAPRVLDIHSRYDVRRWIDDPPVTPMRDLAEAREWVYVWDALHAADPRLGAWAIVAKDTGVVAGTVLLASVPNSDGLVQIGWHLHPDSTGRGYVTEAAPVLLARAFEHPMPEVYALMFIDNAPSAAVCERLGMRDLGIVEKWYEGESRCFRTTYEEWRTR